MRALIAAECTLDAMPSERDTQRPPEPVLVSACLLGCYCRHDGRTNEDRVLERELEREGLRAVPFCPEEHGGLGTPRPAAWIRGGDAAAVLDGQAQVCTEAGADVSRAFLEGARGALALCRAQGIRRAYLKERSPSCGTRQTHVDGQLAPGPGLTSALLARSGIEVRGVEGRRD
jgi:uncharacterized protein YbbK (DUF523 family)